MTGPQCEVIARADLLADDELQQIRRSAGVGASEIGAALGLDHWTSELELFHHKRTGEPFDESEQMYWGRVHEAGILARRAEDAIYEGLTVVPPRRTYQSVRCRDLFASPDAFEFPLRRRVDLDAPEGIDWCDDAKHVDGMKRTLWLERGPDVQYLLQVQAQCYVVGADHGALLALFGGNRYQRFVIEADPEVGEMLAQVAVDFMARVRDGRPPAPDPSHRNTARLLATLHRGRRSEKRVLSPRAARALLDLEALGQQQAWVKDQIDEARNLVRAELGDATEGVCPHTGKVLVTWPEQKDEQIEISVADLRRDFPLLYRAVARRVGRKAGRTTRLYPRRKALDAARNQIAPSENREEP